MSDCTAACLAVAPDFSAITGCGLKDAIRSGFLKNFIALRCDETIADITDDTAIAAQVAAGKVFTSPVLADAEIPFPTTGDEIVENCNSPQPTSQTYAANWKSYRVDNTTQTDGAEWNDFYLKLTTWTVAFVTCDDILLVPQDFATSGVFFNTRGVISGVYPNANAAYYEGQLTFKYDQILLPVQLTAAVITALGL